MGHMGDMSLNQTQMASRDLALPTEELGEGSNNLEVGDQSLIESTGQTLDTSMTPSITLMNTQGHPAVSANMVKAKNFTLIQIITDKNNNNRQAVKDQEEETLQLKSFPFGRTIVSQPPGATSQKKYHETSIDMESKGVIIASSQERLQIPLEDRLVDAEIDDPAHDQAPRTVERDEDDPSQEKILEMESLLPPKVENVEGDPESQKDNNNCSKNSSCNDQTDQDNGTRLPSWITYSIVAMIILTHILVAIAALVGGMALVAVAKCTDQQAVVVTCPSSTPPPPCPRIHDNVDHHRQQFQEEEEKDETTTILSLLNPTQSTIEPEVNIVGEEMPKNEDEEENVNVYPYKMNAATSIGKIPNLRDPNTVIHLTIQENLLKTIDWHELQPSPIIARRVTKLVLEGKFSRDHFVHLWNLFPVVRRRTHISWDGAVNDTIVGRECRAI